MKPEQGWVGLVGYVVLYDVIAYHRKAPTLSAGFQKWLAHKTGKPALVLVWSGLSFHLFSVLLKKEVVNAIGEALSNSGGDDGSLGSRTDVVL